MYFSLANITELAIVRAIQDCVGQLGTQNTSFLSNGKPLASQLAFNGGVTHQDRRPVLLYNAISGRRQIIILYGNATSRSQIYLCRTILDTLQITLRFILKIRWRSADNLGTFESNWEWRQRRSAEYYQRTSHMNKPLGETFEYNNLFFEVYTFREQAYVPYGWFNSSPCLRNKKTTIFRLATTAYGVSATNVEGMTLWFVSKCLMQHVQAFLSTGQMLYLTKYEAAFKYCKTSRGENL